MTVTQDLVEETESAGFFGRALNMEYVGLEGWAGAELDAGALEARVASIFARGANIWYVGLGNGAGTVGFVAFGGGDSCEVKSITMGSGGGLSAFETGLAERDADGFLGSVLLDGGFDAGFGDSGPVMSIISATAALDVEAMGPVGEGDEAAGISGQIGS